MNTLPAMDLPCHVKISGDAGGSGSDNARASRRYHADWI